MQTTLSTMPFSDLLESPHIHPNQTSHQIIKCMKKTSPKIPLLYRLGLALLAGAAMFGATVTTSQAQTATTSITNNFDAANSTGGWTYWYDIYRPSFNSIILDWDPTMNNGGLAGSGSCVYSNLWLGRPAGEFPV